MFDIKKQPKRVMLKLSGEALKGAGEYGFDIDFLDQLAKKIVSLTKRGIEIVVILGWGNIFRGVSGASKWMDRATGDYVGMLATVMNGIALGEALERNGQPVSVLSSLEMPKVAELFVRKKALSYLEDKKVVISVAGTGNPFFTTDTSAVQKALELNCEYIVKGTKVDGVYDSDPMKNPNAVRFDSIAVEEALKMGLNIMDHSAIAMAMDNKLPLYVCRIGDIDQIGTETMRGTHIFVD